MSLPATTALDGVTIAPGSGLAEAIGARDAIFAMTRTAEEAVLRPAETGAWSHALRHALAARIAARNGLPDLAARHAEGAGEHAGLADPGHLPDGDLRIVLAFMDVVAAHPRDVTAEDVAGLQGAGIADADIVRLAELNAFMAYHCRLIAGLRLLAGDSA